MRSGLHDSAWSVLAALTLIVTACCLPARSAYAQGSSGSASQQLDCANTELLAFQQLLVFAPHPDDEVLGFGGLIDAFLEAEKNVTVIVATDGDAYCQACRFWKNGSLAGPLCTATDLRNLGTTTVDSFAEVRRNESRRAMKRLGGPEPIFLGYPDSGLAAARANQRRGAEGATLHRTDFSMCESCLTCAGYGKGPATTLSATSLVHKLRETIEKQPETTLVATTHPLDGHGDHAALGSFVTEASANLEKPRTIAYAVIHAHTPNGHAHPDCWYPEPAAAVCPCFNGQPVESEPNWLTTQREARYRPDLPARLPDDRDYGEAVRLCLDEPLLTASEKRLVIEEYGSQLGFTQREGKPKSEFMGLMDCNGYLISFARNQEVFVLHRPSPD